MIFLTTEYISLYNFNISQDRLLENLPLTEDSHKSLNCKGRDFSSVQFVPDPSVSGLFAAWIQSVRLGVLQTRELKPLDFLLLPASDGFCVLFNSPSEDQEIRPNDWLLFEVNIK